MSWFEQKKATVMMPYQGTRICAMSSWPVSNACHKGQLPSLSATSMLAPRLHRVSTITGRWRAMALCKGRNLSGDLQWVSVSVMKYTLEKSLLLRHPFQLDTVPVRLIKSRMDKDLPDGAYVMVQQLPNLLSTAFLSSLQLSGQCCASMAQPQILQTTQWS